MGYGVPNEGYFCVSFSGLCRRALSQSGLSGQLVSIHFYALSSPKDAALANSCMASSRLRGTPLPVDANAVLTTRADFD
jgi:hypothetical protein